MTKRREFPAKVRVAAIKRATNDVGIIICEICGAMCKAFHIDRIIADAHGGEPTLENARVICLPCHMEKTKDDTIVAAKLKRQEARHLGARKPKGLIKGHGFEKTAKTPRIQKQANAAQFIRGREMKPETMMQKKMKMVGIDTDAAMLYSVAVELLRRYNMAARLALAPFVDAVRSEGGLMTALHTRKATELAAIEYLQNVARDMRGISSKGEGGGEPTQARNGKFNCSPAKVSGVDPDGEANGASRDATLEVPPQFTGDGNGKLGSASGKSPIPIPSPTKSAMREEIFALHNNATSCVPPHGAPRRSLDAMKRIAKVTTIFDTRVLRDGTPIGDLRWSQIERFIGDNAQEAALLNMIRKHGVPSDPNARIRDIISEETMQKFIQKSAEIADAIF